MLYIKVIKNGVVKDYIKLGDTMSPSDTSALVNTLHQQQLTTDPTAQVEIWFGRDGEYAIKVKG
jgi:hypothetical protein